MHLGTLVGVGAQAGCSTLIRLLQRQRDSAVMYRSTAAVLVYFLCGVLFSALGS